MLYLFLIGFFVVYVFAPIPIQILLVIADMFLPDPIPAIDEIFMVIILGNKMRKMIAVRNFITRHKILTALIGAVFIVLIITIIGWIASFL